MQINAEREFELLRKATPDWKSETEKKTHKYENPRTRIILLNLSDNQR